MRIVMSLGKDFYAVNISISYEKRITNRTHRRHRIGDTVS